MAQVFEKVLKPLWSWAWKSKAPRDAIRMAATENSKDRTVINLSGRMRECLPSMVMARHLIPDPRECQKEKLLVRM